MTPGISKCSASFSVSLIQVSITREFNPWPVFFICIISLTRTLNYLCSKDKQGGTYRRYLTHQSRVRIGVCGGSLSLILCWAANLGVFHHLCFRYGRACFVNC